MPVRAVLATPVLEVGHTQVQAVLLTLALVALLTLALVVVHMPVQPALATPVPGGLVLLDPAVEHMQGQVGVANALAFANKLKSLDRNRTRLFSPPGWPRPAHQMLKQRITQATRLRMSYSLTMGRTSGACQDSCRPISESLSVSRHVCSPSSPPNYRFLSRRQKFGRRGKRRWCGRRRAVVPSVPPRHSAAGRFM
jgi:hypothetical protein